MDELFQAILHKADAFDESMIDSINQLHAVLFEDDIDILSMSDAVERNATILWNKAVSLTRDINRMSEEKQSIYRNYYIPKLRALCVNLFVKFVPENREKIFRSATITSQAMLEAQLYEESIEYFNIARGLLENIDFLISSNAQCLVQLFIVRSRCLIACSDPDYALETIREFTSKYTIASTSLAGYLLRTSDNLRSLKWSTFTLDHIKGIHALDDSWVIDAASLHIAILISEGKNEEASSLHESLTINTDGKEYIRIKASILCHNTDINALIKFGDHVAGKYLSSLARVVSEHVSEIGSVCIPFIKKAVKYDPVLIDCALNAAIKLNDFQFAAALNFSKDSFSSIWNHAIDLRSNRQFVDAAQWVSLLLQSNSQLDEHVSKILRFQSRCFMESNEYAQAELLARESIKKFSCSSSHALLICILIYSGKLSEACEYALNCDTLDSDSLSSCSCLLINSGYIKEAIKLCLRSINVKSSGNTLKIITAALQRCEDTIVITSTLIKLSNYIFDFEKLETAVMNSIAVTCYNYCKNGPLDVLIFGLNMSINKNTSEALSKAASHIAFKEGNIEKLTNILSISLNKSLHSVEAVKIQLSILRGESLTQEISLISTEDSLLTVARSMLSSNPHSDDIIALLMKAKELTIDSNTSSILLLSLIQSNGCIEDYKNRFLRAMEFVDSVQFSIAGLEGLVAFAWNIGRELIGIGDAEWWLSRAISLCSKYGELSSLHEIISPQYEHFLSNKMLNNSFDVKNTVEG